MPELQRWEIQEPYLRPNGDLLEGPFYEPENNHLRFVDIIQRKLHVIDIAEGPSSLKTIDFDIPVGVTADIEGVDSKDKILIGGKAGIAILDRNTGKYEYIRRFYDDADEARDDRIRSNDGNVDSEGRMWIATMTDFHAGPCKPEGHLLSFDSNLNRATHRSELVIPNSVGWSLSNSTLYLVHSTEATIYAYDFDATTGAISNPRVFWKLDTGSEPDGFAIDVEGYIWQAVYGDGKVLRISPEGKTVGEIILPTRNVTCCAFAGEDLWITTASESAENAKTYPESARNGGALYKINVGITGVEKHKFKLTEETRKT
ncbi:rRNA-processing protein cgr1 [Pseudogymnoascus australis]